LVSGGGALFYGFDAGRFAAPQNFGSRVLDKSPFQAKLGRTDRWMRSIPKETESTGEKFANASLEPA
jgi:hypothetical protein